ncbi:MAG: UDP-glucose 4-epimerase GalE [Bacteroidales bacterium]|nr:UDP-glucose 4-epimerase GalE [Bacteroidales bacterium]
MYMKILVAGGTGYIGSHTVVELMQQGYEVVIVDNLCNSYAGVVDSIAQITGKRPDFLELDLADADATECFFNHYTGINAAIHFAAHKAVGESVAKPLMYYRNNLYSLINLIKNMEKQGAGNLVFSSSCTVYGQPDELPVSEQSLIKPAWSPYGNTKQVSEEIIHDVCIATKLKAIALRYFNPIGAHASALIGEYPIGVPNNLMPFITQTAIGKREVLSVFGDDYPTPDGTAIRDYIHVVDLAKAHVVAVKRMLSNQCKSNFEVFNLGTGSGYSVLEVLRSFEKVSGIKINFKIVARRAGDIEQVWADTSFANRELGWKAALGLDEMTHSAWEWEKALRNIELKTQ